MLVADEAFHDIATSNHGIELGLPS
jgi:hypothetical protein